MNTYRLHRHTPSPPAPHRGPRPGFTMIELLTAVSILALMLGLAARIFYDAQEAVGQGMKTSQIIAEQRAVSQPIFDDFRNMHVFESLYGGNTPGFLVIAQRQFPGVLFPPVDETGIDPSGWLPNRDGDGIINEDGMSVLSTDDLMRSDQIAFFRDADGLKPLTPGGLDRYDSKARARTARVWYGHVWPAGVPVPGGANGGSRPGAFNGSATDGLNDNNLASQLVLGRQALLLVENNDGTKFPDGTAGNGFPTINNRVLNAGTTRLDRLADLVEGKFDVLNMRGFTRDGRTYQVYDDTGADPAGVNPRGLFRTPTHELAPADPNDQSYMGRFAGAGGLPGLAYLDAASEWLFLQEDGRLQAATSLEDDFSAGIFTVEDISQLHAAFSPHVADFAIEFACDWSDDLDLEDYDGDNDLTEPDGLPDNEPDRDRLGNIVWYTTVSPNSDNDFSQGGPQGGGTFDGRGNTKFNEPVTYLVPDRVPAFIGNATPAQLAATITTEGRFKFTNYATGHNVLVWSHTGAALQDNPATLADETLAGCGKYWPYLIRIRYRLMDGKGDFRSTDPVTGEPVVGRWFEQIVAVPRPQGVY